MWRSRVKGTPRHQDTGTPGLQDSGLGNLMTCPAVTGSFFMGRVINDCTSDMFMRPKCHLIDSSAPHYWLAVALERLSVSGYLAMEPPRCKWDRFVDGTGLGTAPAAAPGLTPARVAQKLSSDSFAADKWKLKRHLTFLFLRVQRKIHKNSLNGTIPPPGDPLSFLLATNKQITNFIFKWNELCSQQSRQRKPNWKKPRKLS